MRDFKNRVGEKYTTNEGYEIEIVDYKSSKEVSVKFSDGIIAKGLQYYHVVKGSVGKSKNRIGEKYITNEGYEVEIIEYFSKDNTTIKFKNGFILHNIGVGNLKKGNVKNPYHPSIQGVGYLGEGIHICAIDSLKTKCYSTWSDVLRRCYNEKERYKNPTYKTVTVCEEWHNFQNFAKWYEENWKDYMDSSWQLDKDILSRENKTYSPETCAFVPQEINSLLVKRQNDRSKVSIGVYKEKSCYSVKINKYGNSKTLWGFKTPEEAFNAYKEAKEQYIKEVADKWKDLINEKVYEALYSYTVEITD